MRIITFNANGIRAAARKGFFTWLNKQKADIVCIQETKAQEKDLIDELYRPAEFNAYHFSAEKSGYSGVAIFSRVKPVAISTGLGWSAADQEGRYIEADLGNLKVASLYMPSGSSGEDRQQIKFEFMKNYLKVLQKIHNAKKPFIIRGDWNIVHREIDIKNFKSNQKNSGCLPEERAWLDNLLTKLNFVDAFRVINKAPDQYTWWSSRGQAYAKNVGWRIDYQIITSDLRKAVEKVEIYKAERFSDHAPLIVDYAM